MKRSLLFANWRKPGLLLVFLFSIGFFFMAFEPIKVQAETLQSPNQQTGGIPNAECLACHAQATEPVFLQSGEPLFLRIDVPMFGNSVHGRNSVTCVTCHSNITGFPHPDVTTPTIHDYRLGYVGVCAACHAEEVNATQDSIHGMLLQEGNQFAPSCADCHDPHTQPLVEEVDKSEFAQVCAQCHNGIYEEYAQSVHGEALLEGNEDVPGCVDCHGVHSISDPTTAEFRNSSVYMCADCHTDETKMAKYELSTNVLTSYVADFHGTTVSLFEKTEPGQKSNTAVCYDCHGIHNILSVDDPQKGLAVKENMLAACQNCHPDATTNFPSSWLSHYMPDKNTYPLVYYVDLFYRILIPTVLGGMAIFIAADVYRRIRFARRKLVPVEAISTNVEEEESK